MDCDYDRIYYPNHILVVIKKIEESDDEFEIKYQPKTKVYIAENDNFIKTDYSTKIDIIKNDDLSFFNLSKPTESDDESDDKSDNEPNKSKDLIMNSKPERSFMFVDKKDKNKKDFSIDDDKKYKNLYLKYKLKYIGLKKAIKF